MRAVLGGKNGVKNVKGWLPTYLDGKRGIADAFANTSARSQSEYYRLLEWLDDALKRKNKERQEK